jgi:hypothetical protein
MASPSRTTRAAGIGVPTYKPSTVVHRTKTTILLRSPSSVAKVTAFYVRRLPAAGWRIAHRNSTPFSTNLMAKRTGKGATIQISKTGTGTSISIVTYPR